MRRLCFWIEWLGCDWVWRLVFVVCLRLAVFGGETRVLAAEYRVFVGTYTGGESRGIYSFSLDASEEKVEAFRLAAEEASRSFRQLGRRQSLCRSGRSWPPASLKTATQKPPVQQFFSFRSIRLFSFHLHPILQVDFVDRDCSVAGEGDGEVVFRFFFVGYCESCSCDSHLLLDGISSLKPEREGFG